MEGFLILQRIVGTRFSPHPEVQEKEDSHKNEEKKQFYSQSRFHSRSSLELKIDKGLIVVFSKKDEKQNDGIIHSPTKYHVSI
jgi:hypothetical protein